MIHLFNLLACAPCQQCFSECSFACANWFNKPLGPYVILAMLLSGVEIAMCMQALSVEGELKQCQGRTLRANEVGVVHWLYVQFGFASLNFIFAPYIQFRLWQSLQQEAAEVDQIESEGLGRHPAPFLQQNVFVNVPQHQVKEAFWNVFWHDFGMCGYVFALFGSGYWGYLGTTWFGDAPLCDPGGHVSNLSQLGSIFVTFATLYFVCFACYMQGVSSLEVNPSRDLLAAGGYALAAQQAASHGMPAHGPPMHGKAPLYPPAFGAKPMLPVVLPNAQVTASPHGFMPVGMPMAGKGDAPAMVPRRTPCQRACHPGMLVKLVACLGLDLMGDASYCIPGLGEGSDLAYGPAQAIALKMMFRYTALPALGFTEEILPGTDIMPSATLGWLLEVLAPDNACTRAIGIRSDYSP